MMAMLESSDQAQTRYKLEPGGGVEIMGKDGGCYAAIADVSMVMGDMVYVIDVSKTSTWLGAPRSILDH